MATGKVLGGQHADSPIDFNRKGELTVQLRAIGQVVLKERQLSSDQIASWEEVVPEARTGALGVLGSAGRAAAGAGLPGFAGRAAAAAIGAGIDAASRARFVRVDWRDGSQSLLRLPEKHAAHLRLTLGGLEAHADAPEPGADGAPSAAERALTQVAGLIASRRPAAGSHGGAGATVAQQVAQLAALREQGALTEDEFTAAKARLLS